MRRKDKQTDVGFALELLENCEYATLSTTNPDGSPYAVPVSIALEGQAAYFHCALLGKKLDNIAQNPQVCLNCVGRTRLLPQDFSTEFESAVAIGRARLVHDEHEKIHALRLICLKYAPGNMQAFDGEIAKMLARTGVVKIELESITGKATKKPKTSQSED